MLPSLTACVAPMVYGAVVGTIAYGGYKVSQAIQARQNHHSSADAHYLSKSEEKPKKVPERTEPKDLSEQLTLGEAKAKPQNPKDEIMQGDIKDPRYPADQWKKVQHTHTKPNKKNICIHYWEDRVTGQKHGFKFTND